MCSNSRMSDKIRPKSNHVVSIDELLLSPSLKDLKTIGLIELMEINFLYLYIYTIRANIMIVKYSVTLHICHTLVIHPCTPKYTICVYVRGFI